MISRKICSQPRQISRARGKYVSFWSFLFILILALAGATPVCQAGTWSALAHPPPNGLNNPLLLTDGSVMCGDGGNHWYRLTPDSHGSYVNGTWTVLASSKYTRLFFSSQVLTNGNVYVAGGEYGTGGSHAELYNTLKNTWTTIPQPAANPYYGDAISMLLPSGAVLQGTTGGNNWIYNPNANIITAAAGARTQNEASWVKMTNDCILSVDNFGFQSEHYVPSLNQWINDPDTPVDLYGYGGELGAGFLLPNGKVFFIGASVNTAIYTPGSTVTSPGSWVAGPQMIFGTNTLGAVDAPAAMMVNGKIICALGPTNGYNGPTYFYEYDYTANSFTQINGPTGPTLGSAPFVMTFLDLPDGNVFFISGQGSTQAYIYFPGGSPLAAGKPVINSLTENSDGSYHLVGTGLNGISSGAAYGDDWQMDSNYPLIRLTNSTTSNVYYGRTRSWNSTGVMTGTRSVAMDFTLPANLPSGTYSLVVLANGNPSLAQTFNHFPPPALTGLSAIPGNSQISLSWQEVSGATAYDVLRSSIGTAYYVQVASVTGTNYGDAGLTNGATYYYVVTAVGSSGPSANSTILAATPFGPPATPTGLSAGPASFQGISLSWNASFGASGYNVKRAGTSGGPYILVTTRSSPDFTDTNILSGTPYYYQVSAVSAGGESGNSSTATAVSSSTGDVTAGQQANYHLDAGSGTLAADSSGNTRTGTLVNSPTWVSPGRIGTAALSFVDTSLQYVTVANANGLNTTAGITICAWIKSVDWTGNRRILQKGNADNQYRLLAEGSNFKFDLFNVGSLITTLPPTNQWVHVAGTYNGSSMAIYFNGVLQVSQAAAGSIASSADPMTIGSKNGSGATGDYFNGLIDEVRVFSRGLSVPEINTVMHAGEAAPATPTGVAAGTLSGQAVLTWNPVASAASYNVKRSISSGGPYATTGVAFGNNYTDAGLTNGVTYYYVVSAVNGVVESANSAQVSARPVVGITFFADGSYQGAASRALPVGTYTLAQLQAAGAANDTSSSSRIPPGWIATIYQNDNFTGTSWVINSDTPDFSILGGLNDNMSSCRITTAALPATPTGLVAFVTNGTVQLSWSTSSSSSGYNLKKGTTASGPFQTLISSSLNSYLDTAVLPGSTYYYVVSGTSTNGESADSASASANLVPPPVAPTNLVALGTNLQVLLAWDDVPGASSYNLKRGLAGGDAPIVIATSATNSLVDADVTNGVTYVYLVSAVNSGGESADSSPVTAKPLGPPAVPTGLTAIAGNGQITIYWDPSPDATSYKLKRSTTPSGFPQLLATLTSTNYTDTKVTNGATYYYQVLASGPGGDSASTLKVNATPLAPPPVLLSSPSFNNNQFTFQFSGVDGQSYVVLLSTNLVDWTPIYTNIQTGGQFIFTDTNALNQSQYYRISQ